MKCSTSQTRMLRNRRAARPPITNRIGLSLASRGNNAANRPTAIVKTVLQTSVYSTVEEARKAAPVIGAKATGYAVFEILYDDDPVYGNCRLLEESGIWKGQIQ